MGALVERTQKIIKEKGFTRYTYPEREVSFLLDVQINRLYEADNRNVEGSNIITRIIAVLREWAAFFFVTNFRDHQSLWNGNGESVFALDRHILEPIYGPGVIH